MEFSSRIAYRLVAPRWESTAFSGEGARRYGGRWNRAGRPVVYLAGSRALAALELLVHLTTPGSRRKPFVLLTVELPEPAMESVAAGGLPEGWTVDPPTIISTEIGERWLKVGEMVGLRVPSVLVPEESNVLLNPMHDDFGAMKIVDRREFRFDERL